MASVVFELSPLFTMISKSSALKLLQEMKQQMAALQNNVDEIQQQHPSVQNGGTQEGDEEEEITGNLMELFKSTATFLELAFLVTIKTADCKMHLERIGVPVCDAIRCYKLDPVVQSTVPSKAIKAGGYLSCLHQFWLDEVTPLMALIGTAEGCVNV